MQVVKRDGTIVEFNRYKIMSAVQRCLAALGRDTTPSIAVTDRVVSSVCELYSPSAMVQVEQIQDLVEVALIAAEMPEAARAYMRYRDEHAKLRDLEPVPQIVQDRFSLNSQFFKTPLQEFQFYDKYARFDHDLGVRETWSESVDRAVGFLQNLTGGALVEKELNMLKHGMLHMNALPSMRLMATAGPAAARQNASIYNCSYLPIADLDAYREALLISMAGCGVGFSVERQYVERLPRIKRQTGQMSSYTIDDTTEAWGQALIYGLNAWFNGEDVVFNYDRIRPAGAVLKTKGGRASGPEPLRQLMVFARNLILSKQGWYLTSLDAHDLMCAVGGAAVAGGHRRTAMISLFDYDDKLMAEAKTGNLDANAQRWNANNSAVWPDRDMSQAEVMRFVMTMDDSKRGEPGIFSRRAANATKADRRLPAEFGCNPCGEIYLRPYEFCNLSIAVARADDTLATLVHKINVATIIGTIQSMATDFPGLRDDWRRNCEEERLLGVDITGQMDCPMVQDAELLQALRDQAVKINREWAIRLGINQSVAVTCVKPSGNSSRLLDCSPGLHGRWDAFYINRVRVSAHGPIYQVLKASGVPMKPENGQTAADASTWVVSFPVKAPVGAVLSGNRSAIEQCEYWKKIKLNWTEHNPSVTITYKPDELIELTSWVYQNQEIIGGMAFLPYNDAQYEQMPYESVTEAEYNQLLADFPKIDWSELFRYEKTDHTEAAQLLACLSGSCDI